MMKAIKLIGIVILILGCKNEKSSTIFADDIAVVDQKSIAPNSDLIVIDQNYDKALKIASTENKLIFIDFYTTWCGPCKQLDKLVFRNDSIKQILKRDFILLKYDAENDSIFHLSKKHHIKSYPSALILDTKGFVYNKKYGFSGNDYQSLSKSVLEFTNESIELNRGNNIITGYSNQIDASLYPAFYANYINRTDTKVKPAEVNNYLNAQQDIFSETYFSVLWYFSGDVSDAIANKTIENKAKYRELYGKLDTDVLMFFLTARKFNQAISEKSQEKFDIAVVYAKKVMDKNWIDNVLPQFEKDLLKAQNQWDAVFEINKNLKGEGKLDNGYINHFSWQVYKDCDNQEVIKKCLKWMDEVTKEEPLYAYLDTYAYLMYKSGDKNEAKRIAQLALETGKSDGDKTASIEKLLKKI